MKKPDVTKTTHILPFSELAPLDFERLCLWLVQREGYLRAEHLGQTGSEQGRDVVAYRSSGSGEELWYFQCKRYQTIGAAKLIEEVEKYNCLVSADPTKKPVGIVFVTSAALAAGAREKVQKFCGQHGYKAEFWARTELDMLVKQHDDIVAEFFNLIRIENAQIHAPQPEPQLSRPPGTRNRDLRYGYSVEFVGREQELSELRDFATSRSKAGDTDFAWWLWTAPGGQGKTRLAAQLCVELMSSGWRCGFLPTTSEFGSWEQWIVNQPTLIVIDHVASRAEKIRNAICAVSRTTNNVRAPLRFLLLERPFTAEDQWLKDFVPQAFNDDRADLFEYVHLGSSNEGCDDLTAISRQLEPLKDDDLWQLITAEMEERKSSTSDRESTLALLRKIDPLLRPLFVLFSLDAIAARGKDGVRKWNPADLVKFIMRREFDLWQKTLLAESEDPSKYECFEQHVNLVTFATIAGRQSLDPSHLLQEYGVPTPNRQLPDWLRVITGYASESQLEGVSPIEPDVLGELFVLERLAGEFGVDSNKDVPKTATRKLLDIAFAREVHQTIDFVRRCVEDFPDHPSIQRFPQIEIPEGDQANYGYYVDHTVHLCHLVEKILENTKRLDLAEKCFDQLVQLGNKVSSTSVVSGDYQMRMASAFYNRGLMRSRLGRVSEGLSDVDEVIHLIDHSVLRGDNLRDYQLADVLARALLLRAELHANTGDRAKAEQDIAALLDANDVNVRAEALLLRTTVREPSDHLQMLGDYEAILTLSGGQLEEVKEIATRKAFELTYQYYEDDELALEYFNRLVRMFEHQPRFHAMAQVDRGNIRLRRNDKQGAEEDWSAVVQDPNSPTDQKCKAWLNRSQLFIARGAFKPALDDVTSVLQAVEAGTRDQHLALLARSQIYQFLDNPEGALADLSTLISDPSVEHDIHNAAVQLRDTIHRRP